MARKPFPHALGVFNAPLKTQTFTNFITN